MTFDNDSKRIPHVAIIGAAKSGTTQLARLLDLHPDISLGKLKEPEYFSFDANYNCGLQWYASNFSQVPDSQLTLDASTGYTRYPQHPLSAKRLFSAAPHVKLIYLMRHPVERTYSHFIHRYTKETHKNERFNVTFDEYVRDDPMCIDSSNYKLQIESYLQYFSLDNMLFLFTSDLRDNRESLLQQVCSFLDLSYEKENFIEHNDNANVTSSYLESRIRISVTNKIKSRPGIKPLLGITPQWLREGMYRAIRASKISNTAVSNYSPPELLPSTRKSLVAQLEPSNRWVEELTGRDLSDWYS